MTETPLPAPAWFPPCKAALFTLLAANQLLYALWGSPGELTDGLAWFVLLVLFELETAHRARLTAGALRRIRRLRPLAGLGVLAAAAGYLAEGQWLDAANAWLWLAVAVLLELEVRLPAGAAARRSFLHGAATLLYGALLLLVPVWAWRGEWLDAWDATLWLAAFFAIELNVLGRAGDRVVTS